ncbi:MAG: hypothetical protein B1H04_00205 [Planctomycetales bacterium 4484_123]|nr:MAG: hypothetical protein B1H04_00205 [Planctomycetales bacterium 4484_123]
MAMLKLTRREKLGTRAARRLRAQGMVPAIVYGHGQPNVPVSVNRHDIELAVQHGERLVKAEVDGQEENFLIKDVQYDYLGHHIVHVDLTRVRLHERVHVTVPIVLRGTPVGVDAEDGVLTQHLDEVECECLATEIPEELRVPVTELHVDDVLRVSDLELPQGVRVLADPETVVASVTVLAEEEELPAAEAEAPAEPEVIGEKKQQEETEEERSS